MNTRPLRVIQLGAGGMGRVWLDVLDANPDVDLVGLADLDVARARAAADDAGRSDLPVAASLAELLDVGGAEAVINVTIPTAHRPTSVEALDAGLPVLCEKPIADSVEQAMIMVEAAERNDRLLMISQSRRYFRGLTALRRQVARIGRLGLVECQFFKAAHFPGFREEMAYPLLIDMAIHQFDLARDLIGADPESVWCESFNPPWSWFAGDAAARVSFTFPGGCRFGFTGSWVSGGLETSWNGSWRLSGVEGTAFWDGDHDPEAMTTDGEAIIEPVDDVPEELAGALAEFVTCLRTGARPANEARRNVTSLAMVEAAIRSAEAGRRVLIEEIVGD